MSGVQGEREAENVSLQQAFGFVGGLLLVASCSIDDRSPLASVDLGQPGDAPSDAAGDGARTPTADGESPPCAADDAQGCAGAELGAEASLPAGCSPGTRQTCATVIGALGVCGERSLSCSAAGAWIAQEATCAPGRLDVERCDDARLDEDCDGESNEGCLCNAGETATCGDIHGAVGDCALRVITCGVDGTWPDGEACAPSPGTIESCASDGHDENCDGLVNEPPACAAFTSISSDGVRSTCGIATDGGLYCWGARTGDGTSVSRSLPVRVLENVRDVHVGFTTCAVLDTDAVYCWGRDANGLFSAPLSDVLSPTATGLSVPRGATFQMESGLACILDTAGRVACWRSNPLSTTPIPVAGVQGAVGLAVAQNHGCALIGDGTVRCWGQNAVGELGSGDEQVSLDFEASVQALGITNAVAVRTSSDGACALLATGSVQCWGYAQETNIRVTFGSSPEEVTRFLGIDGMGTPTSLVPVTVPSIDDAIELVSKECVLRPDSSVNCWTPFQSLTPFDGAVGVRSFAGSATYACMLLENGLTRCGGVNTEGQLGIGLISASGSGQVLGP